MSNFIRSNIPRGFLRLLHKQTVSKSEQKSHKVASDVVNYLENSPEYKGLVEKLPKSLLRKYKTPENMYLINKNTAQKIASTLKKYIAMEDPLIEVNPGMGFLSEELLKILHNKIYMYETSNHFSSHLNMLQSQYPERVIFKEADFFGMWKLAFKDKIDNGNRISELLGDLSTNNNNRDVKIIGSMPGLNFIKHLINNIVFHNSNNQLGKPDLFITMPGYNYELSMYGDNGKDKFVSQFSVFFVRTLFGAFIGYELILLDPKIQKSKHKSVPALFQMLFDYKVITSVPKVHFLPWTYLPNIKKISMMDECNLYLVNITQKDKLPCPPEYLPLLWYFFKPHMFSMTTKVIPMLEQWIPGCGVWLISGQDPPDTNKVTSPTEEDAELPHMTIFTEFGDLSLRQKITIFKKFISWPEFEQSPFKVTMENNLPKFILNLEDDDKDSIGTHIDADDMDHSDAEIDTYNKK